MHVVAHARLPTRGRRASPTSLQNFTLTKWYKVIEPSTLSLRQLSNPLSNPLRHSPSQQGDLLAGAQPRHEQDDPSRRGGCTAACRLDATDTTQHSSALPTAVPAVSLGVSARCHPPSMLSWQSSPPHGTIFAFRASLSSVSASLLSLITSVRRGSIFRAPVAHATVVACVVWGWVAQRRSVAPSLSQINGCAIGWAPGAYALAVYATCSCIPGPTPVGTATAICCPSGLITIIC